MNNFCKMCTGNNKEEILSCKDRNCPFYKFKKHNLKYQLNNRETVEMAVPFDGNVAGSEISFKRHKKK